MYKNVKNIAHRGYSGVYPANTEIAFIKAREKGFDGAETDVRITADGEFIINHDSIVRFADGTELVAEETDLATLLSKPIMNDTTDDEVYVCTFRRYLEIMREGGMICFVEIKSRLDENQIKDIYDLMRDVYDIGKCVVQSFDFDNITLSRQYVPGIPIMLTHGMGEKDLGYERCFDGGFSIDVDYNLLDEELISAFHSRGLEVGVWTVNNEDDYRRLREMDIDYIESDYFCN